MTVVCLLASLLTVPRDVEIDVARDRTAFTIPLPAAFAGRGVEPILEDQASPWLAVYLVDESHDAVDQPLLGEYRRSGDRLTFTPRHRLMAGGLYRVRFQDSKEQVRQQDYRVPGDVPLISPRVERVYPTTDVVPANLLKFYIHFSQPMREGREIFERIRLIDQAGREAPAPWRPTELWNANATRLTLWIHPGRIKQGVDLREVEGPVLEAGKTYTLVVSTQLQAASGAPLANEFRKTVRVVGEDHEMPQVTRWQVKSPAAGTLDAVRVLFPEALDPHLAMRCITVADSASDTVAGKVEIVQAEREWLFTPSRPWKAGEYTLMIDDILEDLAGNTPAKPFEVDLEYSETERPPLTLRFHPVEPPSR